MSYETLLLDLDNTIIDFDKAEEVSLDKLYDTFMTHTQTIDKKIFKQQFLKINKALWAAVDCDEVTPQEVKERRFSELIESLKLELSPLILARQYEQFLGEATYWFSGAENALDELRKSYKIGFITNGLQSVQQKKQKLLGLDQWCDCFVISEEVGVAKPRKQIFDIALEKLQATVDKVLMVGDSLTSDFLGAKNSGIDFCWVNIYGSTCNHPIYEPDYEVSTFAELPKVLEAT